MLWQPNLGLHALSVVLYLQTVLGDALFFGILAISSLYQSVMCNLSVKMRI